MWNWVGYNQAQLQIILSVVLVVITGLYTFFTYSLLRHAQESSKKEWRPEIHLMLQPHGHGLMARITNLGRTAVLADSLFLQAGGRAPFQRAIDAPIQTGQSFELDITADLLQCKTTQPATVPKVPGNRAYLMSFTENQIIVEVWVGFYAQGEHKVCEPIGVAISAAPGRLEPGAISHRMNIVIPPIQHRWIEKPRLWLWRLRKNLFRH